MRLLTVRVPEDLAARLEVLVESRGTTRSEIVRVAIEAYLDRFRDLRGQSFLDAARDVVGVHDGHWDLSHARKHMKGFGA